MIVVQSPGMFTTVQDLGRFGFGAIGVSPSGAADPVALSLGNQLVGNPQNSPALEMTLLGGTFQFPEGGVIAITGSDFKPALDGAPLPLWTACPVSAGQTLKMGPTQSGARCYLSVRGGIVVEPFLGSASTHILTHLGGVEGRPLKKGDVLKVNNVPPIERRGVRKVPSEIAEKLGRRTIVRATVAPQTRMFTDAAIDTFYKNRYRVTEQSNRMGLRLEGTPIETPYAGNMVTEGVSLGAIQVPAGGQPIILFVEQQTTGGYPKIANIVSADLPSIGQLRPNDVIQFEFVSPERARELLLEHRRMLEQALISEN